MSRASCRPPLAVRLAAAAFVAAVALGTARIDSVRADQSTTPRVETPARAARVDRDELMRVVRTLSQPSFEGRRTGTPGSLLARRFIRDAFQQIGVAPAVPGFLQSFSFVRSRSNQEGQAASLPTTYNDAANVLAVQAGTQPGARTIVVSAHYDHLGVINGALFPGADDNASGVAALLAVARYVHAHPLAHRVVFAAFDAEELGLEGAKAFVRSPPVSVSTIALDINFDMVARNDRNEIYAAGTFQNPSLRPIVANVQSRAGVTIRLGHDRPKSRGNDLDDWTPQSDHGVFHEAGIPFLYFGVEDHPDYHKATDTAHKINPRFFGDVVEMLVDFVVTADQQLSRSAAGDSRLRQ